MPEWRTLVALCVVLLQLITALHFALISHNFNATSGGFVHAHASAARASSAAQRAPRRVSLVSGVASCASDSCPIGFAGPVSTLLSSASLSGLIALPVIVTVSPLERVSVDRAGVLSRAPKTSPPTRVRRV